MIKPSTSAPASSAQEGSSAPSRDYAESGVDRSLIRWMLSLSPIERLMAIQQQVNAVQDMKAQIGAD